MRELTILFFILLILAIPSSAEIITVDDDATGANDGTSWEDAFNYLQDALAAAYYGDEIRVSQGVYKPDQGAGITPGDCEGTFQLKNGVAIKGGYAGFSEPDPDARDIELYETILSGDLAGNDVEVNDPEDLQDELSRAENSYHVATASGTDANTVLDGFTITAGNANGSYPSCNGGGMYNKYGGSPTVVNCTFTRNSARVNGGGMYIFMYSDPLLSHCAFIGNNAGGGGGVYNSGGTEQNICEPKLINCVFGGNSGGGLNNHGRPMLTGCTFSGNSGNSGVGGMFDFFGRATLVNCILWGNTGGGTGESAQIQTYDQYVGDIDINYCCIQGWTGIYGGVGNTGDDPLFVDADGGDNVFGTEDDNPRLLPGSSCLDAGDNDSVPTDSLDLDGDGDVSEAIPFDIDRNQRFIDETSVPDTGNGIPPIVDIGAYESINQGFLLSTQSIIVVEGGTATFTVALAIDPLETIEVTVARESGDPDIAVFSGGTLIFDSSNYFVHQSVTLIAAEDADNLHGAALVQIIAEGFAAAGVSASEEDNDPIPTVLYVDANAPGLNDGVSWEDAYIDLQDAIGIAMDFPHVEEIRVAKGIYRPAKPRGSRGAAFRLVNSVAIKGGYGGYGQPDPNQRDTNIYETILSGDLNGDDIQVDDPLDLDYRYDNSHHVVTGSGTDQMAVLDGFTVTGGSGVRFGGGMYNDKGSPTIINCTFSWNGAAGSSDCAGGGMFNNQSSPTLIGCTFSHNAASWPGGGGISNLLSSPTLINCVFVGNKSGGQDGGEAGAMDNWEDSSPTLINCVFIGNYAEGLAGAIFSGGNYVDTVSSPTLINCTFVGNSAGYRGGAIIQESGTLRLTNCIMWDNTAPEGNVMYLRQGYQVNAIVNISYSDIEGWQSGFYIEQGCTLNWGLGNMDVEPLFVKPGYWDANYVWIEGDYHLRAGSPCINAGDPNYVAEPNETDLDGKPRVIGGRIDMGAYEAIATTKGELTILPRTINRGRQDETILAVMRLPESIINDDIDIYELLVLFPGAVEAIEQNLIPTGGGANRSVRIRAVFDKDELLASMPDNGDVEVTVVGRLISGACFYGTDKIRIIGSRD